MPIDQSTRRRWMRLMGASAASLATLGGQNTFPGKRPMLVQNEFPEDLEMPLEYFDTWITPNDAFFVRQHLPRPRVEKEAFRLTVDGMVSKQLTLSLDDLRKMPQFKVPATLECAGNGRKNYRPRMPGLQWSKGAIGNAEWRGPRVADILARAGAAGAVKFVHADGADVGAGKTPDFIRCLPLRKAMHPSTLVALEMNGEPLPDLHGFPTRLIVPGWDGASWVKWLSKLTASDKEPDGFFYATAYRYPKHPGQPGVAPKPEEMIVLEGMAVKSFFARPADQAKVALAKTMVGGIAWAGEEKITRVEFSADGGATWRDAELSPQNFNFAWRLWKAEWTPPNPGYFTLCCRATDSAGRVQAIEPPWNPSGYLWNAIDRIGVVVEG